MIGYVRVYISERGAWEREKEREKRERIRKSEQEGKRECTGVSV